MDPDQFTDGCSLIRAHRVYFHDKVSEVQLKITPNVKCICTFSTSNASWIGGLIN